MFFACTKNFCLTDSVLPAGRALAAWLVPVPADALMVLLPAAPEFRVSVVCWDQALQAQLACLDPVLPACWGSYLVAGSWQFFLLLQ